MTINVSPRTRDIQISFNSSCECFKKNLCCVSSDDHKKLVYVNSEGIAEKFNKKKVTKELGGKEESFKRSFAHLNRTIVNKISSYDGNPDEFYVIIGGLLETIQAQEKLCLGHIKNINSRLDGYYFHHKLMVGWILFSS